MQLIGTLALVCAFLGIFAFAMPLGIIAIILGVISLAAEKPNVAAVLGIIGGATEVGFMGLFLLANANS